MILLFSLELWLNFQVEVISSCNWVEISAFSLSKSNCSKLQVSKELMIVYGYLHEILDAILISFVRCQFEQVFMCVIRALLIDNTSDSSFGIPRLIHRENLVSSLIT